MKPINIFIVLLILHTVSAQQVFRFEDFSNCQLNGNWSMKTITGSYGFELSSNNQSVVASNGCMVQYQQTNQNSENIKQFQLISPEFNLVPGLTHYLVFNYRYVRPINANFIVSYDGPKGKVNWSLPVANDYTPYSISIPSTSGFVKTKFTIEYSTTTNDFGNQIYLDDILFISDNADCSRAQDISASGECLYGHTLPYQYYVSGGQSCSGDYQSSIWYRFVSDYTGLIELKTKSDYNNAISVYEGACGSLTAVNCVNSDEYGFVGERLEMNVINGKTYYFKLSRKINDFGRENGLHCISLTKLSQSNIIKPPHDVCANSKSITVNGTCEKSVNYQAGMENSIPSANTRSRADVWYKFTAVSNKTHQIITHADFAEVIALYSGSCTSLKEIAVEDLGGRLSFIPQQGKEYYVQVSGYFSTIEGDLCTEVKELLSPKPVNDECVSATAIPLNTQCNETQFTANNISTRKPSCVVYNAPDVWYSFVAPADKEVALRIDAGFIYNWAIYEGPCSNLTEVLCGKAPDPCDGFLTAKGLIAGKTYYLQIIAATTPLKAGEGKLCVRIDETKSTQAFQKLRLNLITECLHGVLTRVTNYTVSGGNPAYDYYGPGSADYFAPGTEISAFVDDANGCRAFAKTEASCVGGTKCKNSNLDIKLHTDCITDSIGRQTGEVNLNFNGTGGSGAYYYYGTPNNSILKNGDSYKIILIDSDSCYVMEEGKINCEPFTCAQSNLKVLASYDCIDTLLKAKLQLNVSGALGSFTLSGNSDGELLNQNDNYQVIVTDQAGCTNTATGSIRCKFDSCAYARPNLEVSYRCLRDSIGQTSGLAELTINGSSYAGPVTFIGNKSGDILKHLDAYKVEMIDPFGCSVLKDGIVNCVPLQVEHHELSENLVLIPNPNEGAFIIKLSSEVLQPFSMIISNAEGKTVVTKNDVLKVGENTFEINMQEQSSGLYYISLLSNSSKSVVKMIKI